MLMITVIMEMKMIKHDADDGNESDDDGHVGNGEQDRMT